MGGGRRLHAAGSSRAGGLRVPLAHVLLLQRSGLALGAQRLAAVGIRGRGRASGGSTSGRLMAERVRGLRRRVDIGQSAGPVLARSSALRSVRRAGRLLNSAAPGRAGGPVGLVSLGMDVGRLRGAGRRSAVASTGSQQLKPGLDVRVSGVELGGALVRIEGVGDLVVARLVLHSLSASVLGIIE